MSRRLGSNELLRELESFLRESDFFVIYPSKTKLRALLSESSSNTDKIRAILRDEQVQQELFPDYDTWKDTVIDPIDHYLHVRIEAK